jgi:hypothetical protein
MKSKITTTTLLLLTCKKTKKQNAKLIIDKTFPPITVNRQKFVTFCFQGLIDVMMFSSKVWCFSGFQRLIDVMMFHPLRFHQQNFVSHNNTTQASTVKHYEVHYYMGSYNNYASKCLHANHRRLVLLFLFWGP